LIIRSAALTGNRRLLRLHGEPPFLRFCFDTVIIIAFAKSFFLYSLSPQRGERARVRGEKKKLLAMGIITGSGPINP